MAAGLYIGDELSATAYRMAGLAVRIVAADTAADTLEAAIADRPPLILLGAAAAGNLDPVRLHALIAAADPPILVVADAAPTVLPPDLGEIVRKELGILR